MDGDLAGVSELLRTLERLGVNITVNGDKLRLTPASKLTPELLKRLKEAKPAILRALQGCPATEISCRYDWAPGYRGLRLACVTHQHEPGSSTVFRFVSNGHDALLEMLEKGILTGQALRDASRPN